MGVYRPNRNTIKTPLAVTKELSSKLYRSLKKTPFTSVHLSHFILYTFESIFKQQTLHLKRPSVCARSLLFLGDFRRTSHDNIRYPKCDIEHLDRHRTLAQHKEVRFLESYISFFEICGGTEHEFVIIPTSLARAFDRSC